MPSKLESKAPIPLMQTDKGICLADLDENGNPRSILYALRLPKSTERKIGEYVALLQTVRKQKYKGSVICDCRLKRQSNTIVGVWIRRSGVKTISVEIDGRKVSLTRAAFRQIVYRKVVASTSCFETTIQTIAENMGVSSRVALKAYQGYLDAMVKRDKPETPPTLADDIRYFAEYGGAWSEYRHSAEFAAALAKIGNPPNRQGEPIDRWTLRYGHQTRYSERFNCDDCRNSRTICPKCESAGLVASVERRLAERRTALERKVRELRQADIALGRWIATLAESIRQAYDRPLLPWDGYNPAASDIVCEPTDLERWGMSIDAWIRRIERQGETRRRTSRK